MNQSEFEAELPRESYQILHGGQRAGMVNAEHAHDFAARVMVMAGEVTITRDGKSEPFRAGDSHAVPTGCIHAEQVGPQGVAYIAGRRTAA